ncbi:MAG: sigma factor, partial [Candidatus Caldatribacteriota bacterium]|nr:sigma factor [Candidatus Caldatribacteriota bacterium]
MMEIEQNKEVIENDVIKYQPLVKTIAHKFINSGEPMDDLEQLGYIGLINAINLYSKQKNVKFETYASWFISGEIRHY